MLDRRRVLMTGGAMVAAAAMGPVGAVAAPTASDLVITDLVTYRMKDALFVKLVTDSGVEGWGEFDQGIKTVTDEFVHAVAASIVLGRDPFDSTPIGYEVFYKEHDFGPGGVLANTVAGIDIALWDLKGKILGLPCWALLGGRYRDRMPVCGSIPTDRWQKYGPKEAARRALPFVERGVGTVKCRMQVRETHLDPTPDRTVEYVGAFERLLPKDVDVFPDINNGYSAKRAIRVGMELYDRFGTKYFEEPCSDQNHAHTAEVARFVPMHVISGEKEYTPFQFEELIRYAKPDYINPDVIKAMGITGLQKVGTLSQVNQRPITLHNTRPTISTAASLHLAASFPVIGPFMEYPEEAKFEEQLRDVMVEGPRLQDGGTLPVPDGPGLGIVLDEEAIRARARDVRDKNVAEFR